MSSKCIRICILLVVVSFVYSVPLFAQEGGPTGLVQYTFQQTDTRSIYEESDLNSFTQRYDLGYRGNIFDPRIFLYDIGGSFFKQDSELDQSRAGTSTFTTKDQSYHARLNVIQGTRLPFTLYTEKYEMPTWTVQPGRSFLTRQSIDRDGLLGSVRLGAGTSLNYSLFQDETKTESTLQQQLQTDQLNKGFLLGLNARGTDSYFNATYGSQNDLEKVANRHDDITNARIAFGLKPGTSTRFDMDANYYDDGYYGYTDSGTTMRLDYAPSADFRSGLRVYGDRIKQHEETGTFASLMEDLFYRISPFLSSTGNFTLNQNQGDFENDTTEALTLGLAFVRSLPNSMTVFADTSVNGKTEHFDNNLNRNSNFYSLHARITKNYPAINTDASAGCSYYGYSSSLGGSDTRYGYDAVLNSRIVRNLAFRSALNFSRENSVGDEADMVSIVTPTAVQATASHYMTKHLTSDNSLSYIVPLGVKGRLDTRVGALFDRGTVPRTYYYDTATIVYTAESNLTLNAGLNFYQDSILQTRTGSVSFGMNYRLRQLIMTLKDDWWRQEGPPPQGVRRNSNLIAQVSRPF